MTLPSSSRPIRIAIASSGLGHISRGVETWARDTADALHELGVDVTLFSGAPLSDRENGAPRVAVPCIRRFSAWSRVMVRMTPGFAWRWGLKNGYGLEQLTFWLNLWRHLQHEHFDILHVQDPMLAYWCRRARMRGRLATLEILAHGTEEPAAFLWPFPFVQHLAPYHLQEALAADHGVDGARPHWVAIPNFVDTEVFRPVRDTAEKRACRARLGINAEAFVVLSIAALKTVHKRVDYLIREIAAITDPSVQLVVAGGRDRATEMLMDMAEKMLGRRALLLCDLPRERVPDLLRAADIFALGSLKEMMPIALLEAMASGLPALVNAHPVMEWIIGASVASGVWCGDDGAQGAECGGMALDMQVEGGLAAAVGTLARDPVRRMQMGQRARARALDMFSTDVVIRQYMEYYSKITGSN